MGVPVSPYFRKYYVLEPEDDKNDIARLKKDVTHEAVLKWRLSPLDEILLGEFTLPILMDGLEAFVETHPEEKQKISLWVAETFYVYSQLGHRFTNVSLRVEHCLLSARISLSGSRANFVIF